MTDELVKQWDEYVESMGSVMGDIEHMAQQMRDRIEALTAERDRLRAALERIAKSEPRPKRSRDYDRADVSALQRIARFALKGETP
jgi:hypothetical protein